jgi:hypothetical protein
MKMAAAVLGAILASLMTVGSSQASPVTETYSFTLGNFVDIENTAAPPITSVSGSFTLNFDPTTTVDNDTADITGSLTGIPGAPVVDTPIGFTTFLGPPFDIEIGGTQCDADCVFEFTNDFVLSLQFPTGNLADPVLGLCAAPGFTCGNYTGTATVLASGYSEADTSSIWFATTGSVNATPLPASWTMMLIGLVGLSMFSCGGRRRATGFVRSLV